MNIAVSATAVEAGRAPQGVPGPVRPGRPAHVIGDDAEAIRIAHALAEAFREGASERDRSNARPLAELDAFSQSLFEPLCRPFPSVSCSNTNSAWQGRMESRCGRTDIGRAMKRA